MKKLLHILPAALMAFGLHAQSLKLSDKNGNDVTGGILNLWGSKDGEIVAYIGVKNIGNASKDVKVKKWEGSITAGADVYFCWDQCYTPAVFDSPTSITVGSGASNDSSFTGHFDTYGVVGNGVVYFTFYDENNTKDSATVRVVFSASPAGVDNISAKTAKISAASPNPANSQATFSYQVPKTALAASLELHNMLGEKISVVNLPVAGNNFTLNTEALKPGVYFCSFVVDGKVSTTQRLVVSH